MQLLMLVTGQLHFRKRFHFLDLEFKLLVFIIVNSFSVVLILIVKLYRSLIDSSLALFNIIGHYMYHLIILGVIHSL